MIGLGFIYALMGVLVGAVALVNAFDRGSRQRVQNTAFWALYAITFLAGSRLPPFVSGLLVVAMVVVAAIGGLGQGTTRTTTHAERETSARRWGNRLFIPALLVPIVTLLGTIVLKRITIRGAPLVDVKQVTLIALGIAAIVGVAAAMLMLRPPAAAPARETRRLMDAVGWAAVLPQMLASLGALFGLAGVGQVVAALVSRWIPLEHAPVAVATYALGMALFTMVMGNAFAAFPVMTAAIGLPVLVRHFGGDPAVMAAVGMLSGFCGTLMTPMAANFNIVPVALLELPDQNAVIRAQAPTGLLLLLANIGIMYVFVFR